MGQVAASWSWGLHVFPPAWLDVERSLNYKQEGKSQRASGLWFSYNTLFLSPVVKEHIL
jgi:hypothetical protein